MRDTEACEVSALKAGGAGDVGGGEEAGEELAAGRQHHFVGRRLGVLEYAAGEHQLAEDRQHGEQQAGADRGDDDGARDVALRVAGFLGQGRDRVEAEERQAQHRRAGHQRGEARLAAVADEGQAQVQRGMPAGA